MWRYAALLGIALSLSVPGWAEEGVQVDPLASLGWLTGDWVSRAEDGSGGVFEEHWTAPLGGTMIGMNRTARSGKTLFFEYLRIEARTDGVYYVAYPKGGEGTSFFMTAEGENYVAFENPDHDYPQKIEYRREGETLYATISGHENGEQKSSSWQWRLEE